MHLNREQLKLAENGAMGHALIRGIAGSGKTTVGVRRITYLLENYCYESDKILFITYNRSLSKYIEYLYKKMETAVNISLFDTEESKDPNVEVKTIDALALKYFSKYNVLSQKNATIAWQIPNSLVQEAIATVKEAYPNCKFLNNQHFKFLKDEIAWIKGCGYTTLEAYQNADRIGRSLGSEEEGPSKLYKQSTNREAIYSLLKEIDRRLFENNQVDGLTANIMALKYIVKHGAEERYQHIIIDEAQDLTKVQLELISALKAEQEESSILFLMDVAQSIYPHAWLTKGRTFKSIGYDMTGKGYKLNKNYRTTTEISQCAYSLLSKELEIVEDENFVKPTLIERHGEYPVYRHFESSKEQTNYVIRLINALKKSYNLKDIAIVSRTNKALELLQEVLDEAHMPSLLFKNNKEVDFGKEEIKLLTMHSVKGLEFKIVILIELNKNIIPYTQSGLTEEEAKEEEKMDRKLLYVGMTRAQESLYLCSYGEASKFIKDIDKKFLTMQNGSRMNAFYQLPYEQYLFIEKIKNKHEQEESIRQWVLAELINNYGYPKELLQVEYPVRSFSQVGLVDIAVINSNNQMPHLFVEVKQRNVAIEEAVAQLKSYMNVSNVTYGIATNGKEIIFLDQQFNEIKDIPVCDITLLPTTMERYIYVDKGTYRNYPFERDINVAEIITENGVFSGDTLQNIKIYSDIAAGMPIEIVDEIKGNFRLPKEWTKERPGLYILNVRGDSMLGAGIESGDMVVIDDAQVVNTNDIGAVYYNGATTLKRVVPMGDSILLMSENPEYEPIQISEGDFKVMGKLVGVIKKV
ncbi:S24 family peptidase [Niameybacter massiliensis]|uniref:S24 family peptidase n=1 Tax=Niameybacter massiliensis TaxID=1658108 RepID=UPI0006B5B138|nr:3'-5' exonuclease [Niameybacter massiliensis]